MGHVSGKTETVAFYYWQVHAKSAKQAARQNSTSGCQCSLTFSDGFSGPYGLTDQAGVEKSGLQTETPSHQNCTTACGVKQINKGTIQRALHQDNDTPPILAQWSTTQSTHTFSISRLTPLPGITPSQADDFRHGTSMSIRLSAPTRVRGVPGSSAGFARGGSAAGRGRTAGALRGAGAEPSAQAGDEDPAKIRRGTCERM